MTRIIAGRAGGRTIQTPRGAGTRPTSDRVREGVFARLETMVELEGARVLDLYAGSGALGLEALSRGAEHLLAVERHRATAALAGRNAATLGFGEAVQVRAAPVDRVLRAGPGPQDGNGYDLALLDPPYPLPEDELSQVLALLVEHGWLAPGSLVLVERSARSPEPGWPPRLARLEPRSYGETAVHLAELLPARGPDAGP